MTARVKRRNLRTLVAIVAVVALVVAFAIWANVGADIPALVAAHDARALDDIMAGRLDDIAARKKELAHFHKGPRPCAIYDDPPPTPDDEIASIERDLRGAGLLDKARDESSLFWRWGAADERRRHGDIGDDEVIAGWSLRATAYERLIAAFAPHRLASELRARTKSREEAEEARAKEKERALSHHELEALQGIWLRHPQAMSFPGYVQTMQRIARE